MQSRIPLFGSLLAIALVVSPALAQTTYKSTMPDGQVIYGDKPAPGAAKVEQTKVAPATKGLIPPTPGETRALKQLEADRAKRDAVDSRMRAAEKALADAEAALAAGKEPREASASVPPAGRAASTMHTGCARRDSKARWRRRGATWRRCRRGNRPAAWARLKGVSAPDVRVSGTLSSKVPDTLGLTP